jgi:hypothetical protein
MVRKKRKTTREDKRGMMRCGVLGVNPCHVNLTGELPLQWVRGSFSGWDCPLSIRSRARYLVVWQARRQTPTHFHPLTTAAGGSSVINSKKWCKLDRVLLSLCQRSMLTTVTRMMPRQFPYTLIECTHGHYRPNKVYLQST